MQSHENGEGYYYLNNVHGDVVGLADVKGEVVNRYQYDAFGNIVESKENVYNRFRYAGEQFDQVTGQYYLRARFYNPVVGRFTQEDTYRGDGLNLYAYVGNNPVNYFDPSGYVCEQKYNLYKEFRGQGKTPKEAQELANAEMAKLKNSAGVKTSTDLYTFGNKTQPRGARPEGDFGVPTPTSSVGPEVPPLPKEASTFDDINKASLTGHYHKLPEGTELPEGLGVIADGRNVNPNSPMSPGHHTVYPTKPITVDEFNDLFKSLPWEYGGKK